MSAQIVGVVVVATCFCLGMLIGISLETRRRRTDDHRRGLARREMAEERAWLAEERAALLYQRDRAAIARRADTD